MTGGGVSAGDSDALTRLASDSESGDPAAFRFAAEIILV